MSRTVLLSVIAACLAAPSSGLLVENYLNKAEPSEVFTNNALSINQLLCQYTPGTAPDATYPGICQGQTGGGSWTKPYANSFNTTSNAIHQYPFGNTSTCIFATKTGNQTNWKGSSNCFGCSSTSCASDCAMNNQPTLIPGAACSQTALQAANPTVACTQVSGSGALYPQGVNPVPAGVTFQGVVFYASSNTHMYLQDPFFPFASIWVYGSSCVGFVDGVAVGMMVQITLPVTANFVISGPTYDSPGKMAGLGGGFDQAAYGVSQDNMWVLSLNMAPYNTSGGAGLTTANAPYTVGVQNYIAGNASNPAICPGMTLVTAAEAWPYEPLGGNYQCTPMSATSFPNGVDFTQPLVPSSTTFAAYPPPPPALDFTIPAPVTLPPGCLTVYQYLCQYTVGNAFNNVTAPGGLTPSVKIAGVFYFGTGTGNAYIQDPFFPYASIWIAGANQSVKASTNSDGSTDAITIGVDPGYAPGMYLMYTATSSVLVPTRAANAAIFQVTLNNLFFNNATCNYAAAGVTTANCPPTNCQLATCNPRNIQAEFGADYCTGQPVTGPTVANTVGCGIQVLASGWPIMGPAPPANSPLLNTGATQCLDNVAAIPVGYSGTLYYSSQIAIGGYSAATFGPVSSKFTNWVASSLGLAPANVTIVQGGVVDTPPSLYIGRRRLQSQTYVSVTYQVAVVTANAPNARTFMSSMAGASIANQLVGAGLTATSNVELLTAPTLTGVNSAPVYVYTSTTTTDNKKSVRLGVGIGVGLGGGLILLLIVLYFTVLKKKNVEQGQKSAVMMTPVAAKV